MFLHGLRTKLFRFSADTGQAGGGGVEAAEASEVVAEVDNKQAGSAIDYKAEAVAEVLAGLGVKTLDEAKAGLASWQEYQEGQKTALEKLQDSLSLANQSLADKDGAIADLQAQLAAAHLGVPADNTADVIVLAKGLLNDQTDISAAISQVLTKYPQFKGGDDLAGSKPSFVTETKAAATTTTDEAFLKALGLNNN